MGRMAQNAPRGLHSTMVGDSGPWLVFCHGLFGQGRNWTRIARALEETHRSLLVDLPDHGRSEWTERFDFGEFADRVATVLPEGEPVTLVGHSLGGKIAMVLALRHPELVERLCVVDVSPVTYDNSREFAGYIEAMQAMDLDALTGRADADAALLDAVPNPTVRSFLLQNLRRDGDEWHWQANLDLLGSELPVLSGWPEDELADVAPYDGPVLWLAGARSDYVRDEYAAPMDRWFPNNRRVTVKDAGHWVHSQKPEVVVEVLRRFLA
jgi:pimeloyl-ACP methyl ester carboxylesterase